MSYNYPGYMQVSARWYYDTVARLNKAEEIIDTLIRSRDEYKEKFDELMKCTERAIEMVEDRDKLIELRKRKEELNKRLELLEVSNN